MPWSESYFPRSMVNLPRRARLKAIEIANALLEEGYCGPRPEASRLAQAITCTVLA